MKAVILAGGLGSRIDPRYFRPPEAETLLLRKSVQSIVTFAFNK
jgi:dTDP-glucose pyrophosphorylase